MSEAPLGSARHALARRGGFVISTDPATTDLDLVTSFLRGTYWAQDASRDDLERSFAASLVYNLLDEAAARQVGFARVVSDRARIAWLSDVFVLDAHRGRGLGAWLVATALDDPRLAGVRRWLLATRDAHPLYRRFGFEDAPPGRYMVR